MEITVRKQADINATFTAPASKSFTHRAIIAASLAEGRTTIRNPLFSEDTEVTVNALKALGIEITCSPSEIIVEGCAGVMPQCGSQTIDCKNSGTSLRHLVTLALLSPSKTTLTGTKRMQERPIGALCEALRGCGADIEYLGADGCPPVRVTGGGFSGGRIAIDASKSSQYVSSILMCAPYAESAVEIMPKGSVASRSYIDLTIAVMRAFGAEVDLTSDGIWAVKPAVYRAPAPNTSNKSASAGVYTVEGDYSSASYFFAAAAVCGGTVTVNGLNTNSVQGDRVFLKALSLMGCRVTTVPDPRSGDTEGGIIRVERSGDLNGIEIDMSSSPDIVQTLCAVCVFAKSPSRISGISHLRYKESDRIEAIRILTESCGCGFALRDDVIEIIPREGGIHGFVCDPRDDHRTAMSAAVIGLGCGDVKIAGAECVAKSFPDFWDKLKEAGLSE
ncbi:MAG: 3-phosphoshikimate 1-carboxyvinyltransferase [Methanomicrobium sp.]|nr:3-phosphoshikimate 1-carboxyvinyltransferase [Methanomicrobium sp.]